MRAGIRTNAIINSRSIRVAIITHVRETEENPEIIHNLQNQAGHSEVTQNK